MTEPEFFTPEELAERWRISDTTVKRLIEVGDLEAIDLGMGRSNPRVPRAAVEDFEDRRRLWSEKFRCRKGQEGAGKGRKRRKG